MKTKVATFLWNFLINRIFPGSCLSSLSCESESFHHASQSILWKWKCYPATQEVLWRHSHFSSFSLHTRLMSPFQHCKCLVMRMFLSLQISWKYLLFEPLPGAFAARFYHFNLIFQKMLHRTSFLVPLARAHHTLWTGIILDKLMDHHTGCFFFFTGPPLKS